jgi:hypothetical protein
MDLSGFMKASRAAQSADELDRASCSCAAGAMASLGDSCSVLEDQNCSVASFCAIVAPFKCKIVLEIIMMCSSPITKHFSLNSDFASVIEQLQGCRTRQAHTAHSPLQLPAL